jgi:rhamnulokinase
VFPLRSCADVAAVDLGASAGRVVVGQAGRGQLAIREVHRFPTAPVTVLGRMHTDMLGLYGGVLAGLCVAGRESQLASIGVDCWGVDFGLIDSAGQLLGNPVHYRDRRTDGVLDRILATVPASELYSITGTQQLPLNTLCQLVAAGADPQLAAAAQLLLLPDLLGYWLTGQRGGEVTNASTTQLLDARTRTWSSGLARRFGIRPELLPPLRLPGDQVGGLLAEAAAETGLSCGLPVLAVASHDTASAVAGTPASTDAFAFISCGTWSLVGMELTEPSLSAASLEARFTNEAGIDGTTRFLRNVMGLWLLQESIRAWSRIGPDVSLPELLASAGREPPLRFVVDVNDPVFVPPGDMPSRLADACRATGQRVPESQAEITRCILDSIALAHRRAIMDAQRLSGRHADIIHIVGGGARDALLCQQTSDACGLPVIAGPAEATAIGNVLVQARAIGVVGSDLTEMRALVRATQPLRRYAPQGSTKAWERADARV